MILLLRTAAAFALWGAAALADESPTPPVADRCEKAMHFSGCWNESSTHSCELCVEQHKWDSVLNCTARESLAYCGGGEPQPGPIGAACRTELIKACEPNMGNHGTVRQCDECVERAGKSHALNCTLREELAFCLPAPPTKPTADACEKDLKRACGSEQHSKECPSCVSKIEAKLKPNCTRRQEETFCARPLPPKPPSPSPPQPSACTRHLESACGQERRDGVNKCDKCAEAAGATFPDCTHNDELRFCTTSPGPRNPCLVLLMAQCESKRANRTECLHCAKAAEIGDPHIKCDQATVNEFC